MTELKVAELVPLQAVASMPEVKTSRGTTPTSMTLYRWMRRGLWTVRIGGGRFTTLAALNDFLQRTGRTRPAKGTTR